jgi:hypothetical protein
MRRIRPKDYDRQTGSTAPERASTAIGEWGDPALEKARATLKDHAARQAILAQRRQISSMQKMIKTINANMAMMGKAFGLEMKGIDESTDEVLDWGDEAPGSAELDEQKPPEVQYGKMKPDKQRIITGVEMGRDEDIEETDTQKVKYVRVRDVAGLVRKMLDQRIPMKTVVRKGFAEQAGVMPENMQRMQKMQSCDGSIESQLALIEEFGS